MNNQSIEQLMPDLLRVIKQTAHRYLPGVAEIDDITQDVLLKFTAAVQQQQLRTQRINQWLFSTTKNASIDLLRQRRRRYLFEDFQATARLNSCDPDEAILLQIEAPDTTPAEPDLIDAIEQSLLALPQEQRVALLMSAQGYTYQEIAEHQGVELGTVRSRIHYARTKLRLQFS